MGLTNNSTGFGAANEATFITEHRPDETVIALAGNPNVGKSTLFNALTGLNQHTGNWPGKTVTSAEGVWKFEGEQYRLVDIPGTYSLMAHSAEEEVARNFICFGGADAVVVVCDASCLERNMNLVLQTLEITENVIVCVNLLDEARRRKIEVDLPLLSRRLGVPVVGTVARDRKSLIGLMKAISKIKSTEKRTCSVKYPKCVERAAETVAEAIHKNGIDSVSARWLALRLLDPDKSLLEEIKKVFGDGFLEEDELKTAIAVAKEILLENGVDADTLKDITVTALIATAEEICDGAVRFHDGGSGSFDRKIDRILTSRAFGYPVMILLLGLVFYITIIGANYPSAALSKLFFALKDQLWVWAESINLPTFLGGLLIDGMYHVLAWVVSVMLPPMAIFFPLFTLLEDVGYLPRIAYNLDKPFKRCRSCGKQALTMCMGFGCNAAGVVGCRIIDSPRERLLAILTNSFVPCNGRFPALISVITMFFIGFSCGALESLYSAAILTAVITLGVVMTLAVTKLLSHTLLKGMPSSFALEMPSYRLPQIGKVIVRSIFDRTLFVLGRAAVVAAPAGMVIWLMANLRLGGVSLLNICADFLDPFARFLGLDGIILIAFILGFPANEIVVPIMIMAYTATGVLTEFDSLIELRQLLIGNGWSVITAICFMLFSLMHWPCSTTLMTIKKETGSIKWTLIAAAIPTLAGMLLCAAVNAIGRIFI